MEDIKKIIVIPDSFKGTMGSNQVCAIMKDAILKHMPGCDVVEIPIADGGEGTVDCILRVRGGKKISLKTRGPVQNTVDSFYGISGDAAIIEIAASAGLPLAQGKLDPVGATTYGVGELMRDAVERGIKNIILGLGGSCTNDGGTGMAAALGVKFTDKNGERFIPTGGTLSEICGIDTSESDALLKDVTLTAMCDIDTPLYGKNGAAYVFAPQKGAGPDTVAFLDNELRAYSDAIQNYLDIKIKDLAFGGAAGGAGVGFHALLGGKLMSGITALLDIVGFDELLDGCDYVFTGEGHLDSQSLLGKAVIGVGERAKLKHVPVIAVTGFADVDADSLREQGITWIYETDPNHLDFESIRMNAASDLKLTMDKILNEFPELPTSITSPRDSIKQS